MRLFRILAPLVAASAILTPIATLGADDEGVRRDLFTVITLHGLPCGAVVSVTSRGENDHIAFCRDGNRYHVFLNAQGRVVVEKA